MKRESKTTMNRVVTRFASITLLSTLTMSTAMQTFPVIQQWNLTRQATAFAAGTTLQSDGVPQAIIEAVLKSPAGGGKSLAVKDGVNVNTVTYDNLADLTALDLSAAANPGLAAITSQTNFWKNGWSLGSGAAKLQKVMVAAPSIKSLNIAGMFSTFDTKGNNGPSSLGQYLGTYFFAASGANGDVTAIWKSLTSLDISFNPFTSNGDFNMWGQNMSFASKLSAVYVGGIEADWLPSYVTGLMAKAETENDTSVPPSIAYNDNDDTLLSVKKDILGVDTSVKTDTPVVTVVTDEKTGDAVVNITADEKTLATSKNEAITNAATDDSSAGTTTGSKTITIPSNNIKFDSDSGKLQVSTGPTVDMTAVNEALKNAQDTAAAAQAKVDAASKNLTTAGSATNYADANAAVQSAKSALDDANDTLKAIDAYIDATKADATSNTAASAAKAQVVAAINAANESLTAANAAITTKTKDAQTAIDAAVANATVALNQLTAAKNSFTSLYASKSDMLTASDTELGAAATVVKNLSDAYETIQKNYQDAITAQKTISANANWADATASLTTINTQIDTIQKELDSLTTQLNDAKQAVSQKAKDNITIGAENSSTDSGAPSNGSSSSSTPSNGSASSSSNATAPSTNPSSNSDSAKTGIIKTTYSDAVATAYKSAADAESNAVKAFGSNQTDLTSYDAIAQAALSAAKSASQGADSVASLIEGDKGAAVETALKNIASQTTQTTSLAAATSNALVIVNSYMAVSSALSVASDMNAKASAEPVTHVDSIASYAKAAGSAYNVASSALAATSSRIDKMGDTQGDIVKQNFSAMNSMATQASNFASAASGNIDSQAMYQDDIVNGFNSSVAAALSAATDAASAAAITNDSTNMKSYVAKTSSAAALTSSLYDLAQSEASQLDEKHDTSAVKSALTAMKQAATSVASFATVTSNAAVVAPYSLSALAAYREASGLVSDYATASTAGKILQMASIASLLAQDASIIASNNEAAQSAVTGIDGDMGMIASNALANLKSQLAYTSSVATSAGDDPALDPNTVYTTQIKSQLAVTASNTLKSLAAADSRMSLALGGSSAIVLDNIQSYADAASSMMAVLTSTNSAAA